MRIRSLDGHHCTEPQPPRAIKHEPGALNSHSATQDASFGTCHLNSPDHSEVIHFANQKASSNGDESNGDYPDRFLKNHVDSSEDEVNEAYCVQHDRPRLLVWSAGDTDSINRMVNLYSILFREALPEFDQPSYLDDLAYTLATRRSSLPWKSFTVARSVSDLRNLADTTINAIKSEDNQGLAFVFTGQGSQWPRMGIELLAYPVVRTSMLEADLFLRSLGCTWSLLGKAILLSSYAHADESR